MGVAVGVHSKGVTSGGAAVTGAVDTQTAGSTFVVVAIWDNGTFTSIADNKGNSANYSLIGSEQAGGALSKMRVYRCENGIGGTGHTATITCSTPVVTAFFVEITGANSASFDAGSAAQASDASSPFTVTSGTLSQPAECVVAVCGADSASNPATIAESSGFTIQESELNGSTFWTGGIATKITAATTALTPSFTSSGSGTCVLTIAGFTELTGASPGTENILRRIEKNRLNILTGIQDEGRFNELDVKNWF